MEVLLVVFDVFMLLGLCDCVMIELMYVSGLWVFELVILKSIEVGMNEGVLCVIGKGSKMCLVLFGEEVGVWMVCYLVEVCS